MPGPLSPEERERRLKALAKHDTIKQAADALSMEYVTLQTWAYRNGLSDGTENNLSEEEETRRQEALENHATVKQAADALGTPYGTLHSWAYRNGLTNGSNSLSEEQRERRLEALRSHDTVREAAEDLDVDSLPSFYSWARDNYPAYDDEFSRPRKPEAGFRALLERVDAALASAQDDLQDLQGARLTGGDTRRVRGALSDLDHARDLIHDEASIRPRGGGA